MASEHLGDPRVRGGRGGLLLEPGLRTALDLWHGFGQLGALTSLVNLRPRFA